MSRAWEIAELDRKAPAETNAHRMLAVRTAEFFSFEAAIADPDDAAALHDARIAAKRLRYTLETFDFVFGDEGAQVRAEIKEWQDLLGQIHDLDVRIALIDGERAARATHDADDGDDGALEKSLAILLARERADRERLHEQAVAAWQLLIERGLRSRLQRLFAPPLAP